MGHKSVSQSFYGYKTHIAMSEERIITAANIISGEAADGKELEEIQTKTKIAGMEVEEEIGDTAYSTLDNLKSAEAGKIKLVTKLNPNITKGLRSDDDGFVFNKDANMMQCPYGHLAKRKSIGEQKGRQKRNARIRYIFVVKKCKECPYREGCYKEGQKTKSYTVSIKSNYHSSQEEFQKSDYFKKRTK